MWPTGGGYYWPQATSSNPTPQQSNPSDWAVKAAQWAQQKTVHEQAYQQHMQMQQQQYLMAAQQQMAPAQQYAHSYSQSLAPSQMSIPQQVPIQPAQPAQPPATAQATPPPLFAPTQQPTPPKAANPAELGPGHIDFKPPMNKQSNYHRGSSGDGFGRQPPRGDFLPRNTRENYQYPGPPRSEMRPRIPSPRGPPPHQRGFSQPRSQSPVNLVQPPPHQRGFSQPRSQSPVNLVQPPPHQRGFSQPRSQSPVNLVQHTYSDNPVHEDYQRTEYNAETQWNEKDGKNETVVETRRADIDDSLYGEHPDNPPAFLQDKAQPKPTSSSKTEKPAMNLSSGMSQRDKEDEHLYANTGMARSSAPTVDSLRMNRDGVGVIPGLGEPVNNVSSSIPVQKEEPKGKSANAENMLASLGKLMTELQGLKGLTSSLQLLNALPQVKKEKSERALSEEANKKAAALLANESDSDGESQTHYKMGNPAPAQTVYADKEPSQPADAREFDGYNVKPQVYNTYSQQGDYPEHTDYRGRTEYSQDYNKSYDNRESGYSDPKRPDYYPSERNRFEDRDMYQEKRNWNDSRDFDIRQRYQDQERPAGDRYPPVDGPPRREARFPPEPLPMRERYQANERPLLRDDRYPSAGPPISDQRYQGEEYTRPPVGEEYSYAHVGQGSPHTEELYREPSRPLTSQKIESFDYGHGGAPAIVDYNHGKKSMGSESHFVGQRSTVFPLPPEPSFPGYPGVGGYSFSPGTMPFFPAAVDPAQAALIAAAYTAQAGEAKRKVLPTWLRDELEKMEAKRQKEMEKEKEENKKQTGVGRATWRDEVDSDEDEARKEEERKGRSKRSYRQKSPSPQRSTEQKSPPIKRKKFKLVEDDEEKEIAKIMKIRRMLTEILLEVTDQEIDVVANEVVEEEKRPKLSFAFKNTETSQADSGENVLAGMSMYNSGSESDQEPEDKKKRKSDEKKRKSDEKKHKSDEKKRSGPVLDPLDVAKAFSGTVVDQTVVPIPPPSKEHREWADKLLSDLTPRSRKDSSRKHSKSEEKRSHSDRRSSQEEYHKSSKLSHKKSSRDKEKESSLKSKGTSHSRSKSSDSPIGSKRPASQGTSHSPPPPSGRSFATGFTVPKAIRGRSRSPGKSTRRKSRRSKSRSLSPPVRRVSYKKDRSRSRSRSPPPNAQRHQGKSVSGFQSMQKSNWSETRHQGKASQESQNKSNWSEIRTTQPNFRIVSTRK